MFFSSHILSDVEMLCDRVCILRKGEVVVAGKLNELLGAGGRRSEIALRDVPADVRDELGKLGHVVKDMGETLALEVEGDDKVRELLALALAKGARVEHVIPKRETLEDLFVRRAL